MSLNDEYFMRSSNQSACALMTEKWSFFVEDFNKWKSLLVNQVNCLQSMSSHTDAIHIGAMDIDGSRMTLPR